MAPAPHTWRYATPTAEHHRPSRIAVLRWLLQGAAHARPGTQSVGLRRTLTHFLRCSRHLETFRDWYGNPARPALQEALALRPALVMCAVHPYVNAAWRIERRLAVLSGHYALLKGPLAFLRFRPPASIDLADVGEGLRIGLDKPGGFEHEGELNINLFSGRQRLYSLAFTLAQVGDVRVAYVGGLQGWHSDEALETYRLLTHRLHGLRPRDLLVAAFRMLCSGLGVARILAVADSHRTSSCAFFETRTQVYASYDSAWLDSGGTTAPEDGFFELGTTLVHRSADDTPARKRAQYRRRYALLDALSLQIDAAVQGHAHARAVEAT